MVLKPSTNLLPHITLQLVINKITKERLNEFEAVIFLNTTADIFDDKEQETFEKHIQSGHGYVGVHTASDTEYD